MSELLKKLRQDTSCVYQRKPALKRNVLKCITNILVDTSPYDIPRICLVNGKIEVAVVDLLTKYIKKNPNAINSLKSMCDNTEQLIEVLIDTINTKMVLNSCIEFNYNSRYTNSSTLYDKIKQNVVGE